MQPQLPQADVDNEREYRAIETALLQTARGRWFLAEHGRRARRVDGQMLEDAISKLQTSLREPPALLGQLKSELEALQSAIRDANRDLRANPGRVDPAFGQQSAHGILTTAEEIHELAWTVQSSPPDTANAEKMASHAARLYALTLQNAVESERLSKLSKALDDIGAKLSAVLETVAHETHAGHGAVPLPDEPMNRG